MGDDFDTIVEERECTIEHCIYNLSPLPVDIVRTRISDTDWLERWTCPAGHDHEEHRERGDMNG